VRSLAKNLEFGEYCPNISEHLPESCFLRESPLQKIKHSCPGSGHECPKGNMLATTGEGRDFRKRIRSHATKFANYKYHGDNVNNHVVNLQC
jgi:hypothetical protein